MRDMLLHGLRSWPSLQVTDARRPNHMYLGGGGGTTSGSPAAEGSDTGDNGDSGNSRDGLVDRSKWYGHGFSYAEWLPPPLPTWQLNEGGSDEKEGSKNDGRREEEDLGDTPASSSPNFSAKLQPLPWQRREPLRAAIARRAFDLVVYGSVHRGLPFLAQVTAAYTKVKAPSTLCFILKREPTAQAMLCACGVVNLNACIPGASEWLVGEKLHLESKMT